MFNGKSDEDYVKLKMRRDPTSSMPDLYGFSISLFDHGDLEEFLLFVWNFNITLSATGTQELDTKIQYLHTLLYGEALRQFDLLSSDVENLDTSLTVNYLIKGLA